MKVLLLYGLKWGLLLIWISLLVGVALTYDGISFHIINWLLISLIVLFFLVQLWVPAFRSDDILLTPKNLMLFVFLNKLVLIPLELLTWGNQAQKFEWIKSPLIEEVAVTTLAFLSVMVGWQLNGLKQSRRQIKSGSFGSVRWLAYIFLLIGIFSVIVRYGSIWAYLTRSFLKDTIAEFNETNAGSIVGMMASMTSRFLPFAAILFWIVADQQRQKTKKTIWAQNTLFIILCIICSLSSNRSNIIYPLLTLLSVMFIRFKVRNKIPIIILGIPAIILLFFFGLVRSLREYSLSEIPNLLKLFTNNFDYVPSAHQIYFGTPYQITPLLHVDYQLQGNTLLSSILFPIPLLGKDFRLTSGVSVYNQSIYGSTISSDQVIPVAGEFYYNFGLLGVVISHLLIGYFYGKIDDKFKRSIPYSKAIAAAWFYLAIHYNAAIFLSISVLIQFTVYSCLPAIILLAISKYQIEENKISFSS